MTEYAGKEVMVILVPKDGKAIKPTVEYFYHELQKAAEEHMELAFKTSQQLKDTFESPEAAVKQFFEKYTPESVQNLRDDMEKWLKVFMSDTLKGQMEELINKHKVELIKFPDNVLNALRPLAEEVLEEEAANDPMSKKVHEAFKKFKKVIGTWGTISEKPYYDVVLEKYALKS